MSARTSHRRDDPGAQRRNSSIRRGDHQSGRRDGGRGGGCGADDVARLTDCSSRRVTGGESGGADRRLHWPRNRETLKGQSAALAADVLDEGLERLTDSGLAYAQAGGRYRFRHALLCDIAYETLLTPRRQSLHARIAETLETMPGDRALAEPEVLARHWFGAGEHERAEAYWLRARLSRRALARPIRCACRVSRGG